MLFKSLAVLAVAAATVSAKLPKHTFFTSPVGDGITYPGGSSQVFSWQKACTSGTSKSLTPNNTEVALVNANNPNAVYYVDTVATIDCRKKSGNTLWTVPSNHLADGTTNYALRIDLVPNLAYSGTFKITKA